MTTSRPISAQPPPDAGVSKNVRHATSRRHWTVLIAALMIIALSFALQIADGDGVALRMGSAWKLPDVCLWKRLAGCECPGCGLTRSFVSLAHGDLVASWRYHHLGWALALLVVLQLPYRMHALRTGCGVDPRWRWAILWGATGMITLNWIVVIVLQ